MKFNTVYRIKWLDGHGREMEDLVDAPNRNEAINALIETVGHPLRHGIVSIQTSTVIVWEPT